jgi:hypothetical protein
MDQKAVSGREELRAARGKLDVRNAWQSRGKSGSPPQLPHLQICGRFHRPKGCGISDDRHRAGAQLEGGENSSITKRPSNTISAQHSKSSMPNATIIAF